MNKKIKNFLEFKSFSNFVNNKKAAIELSVTAIVILILAIVILGLALGFIRGMFTKVSTSFEQQVANEPEPIPASGSEPITLSRETIIANAGDKEVLKVSIYNPTGGTWSQAQPVLGCSDLTLEDQKVNNRSIEGGGSHNFNVLFSISRSTSENNYLCTAEIYNGTTQTGYIRDLVIEIRK